MAFDLAAAEAAIAAWLAAATGLAVADRDDGNGGTIVARILQATDPLPQTPMPYLTYRVPAPFPTAPAEIRTSYDAAQPLGQELQFTTREPCEFTCTVNAFTERAKGGPDVDGFLSAGAYIQMALRALSLPSVVVQLDAAGLVVIDRGRPRDFSTLAGAIGMGRAQVEIRFRCTDSVSEGDSYIDTVDLTATTP